MSDDNSSRPLSAGDIPSSFDGDTEFYEEGRVGKLWRKLRQEPLVPLGIAATCYALYQASKSIRAGDSYQTNRMFRARIYAQGFTLVAIVAGSIFYQDERLKRRTFEKSLEQKKALEKRDAWLKELEARDAEDRAWRDRIVAESPGSDEAKEQIERAQRAAETARRAAEAKFTSKSVREQLDRQGVLFRARDAWRRI